jgi:hypothetical protein
MNPLPRDMVILAALVFAALLWNFYALVTRRSRRQALKTQREPAVDDAQISGLAALAAAEGWTGPSTDPRFDPPTTEYVREALRNMWGDPRGTHDAVVRGPRFTNVYSGQAGNRPFSVGNAWIDLGSDHRPGSLCELRLGEMLPPLFVNLRRYRPVVRFGLKEIPFESEQFNRTFQVLALDRKYAMDMVSERAMEMLMERDDWQFCLEVDRLVCVSKAGLTSVDDYRARLDAVARFAALIPHFVEQDRAAHMPVLPDGTVLNPLDPGSRETFKNALMAMSPEERQEFMANVKAEGARFLAGMLGKDLPPGD